MPQIQVSGTKLSRGKTQAAAILLVFCIPFCLFGLFAVGKAVQMAMLPRHDLKAVFMLGAFGLTFNMIGFGLFLAYFYGAKKVQQQRSLQLAYPQQPWMWRDDWSRGRIGGTTRSGVVGMWIFAILWNLVSMPVAFLVGPQAWATDRKGYLVLIFPAVGIILLILALRQTLAWEEFGKTWFDLFTIPGALGGELRGTIQVHFPSTPEQGAALKLSCINRYTTGSGNDRTTHEKILWRDERAVPPQQIGSGPAGSAIPVSFQIPADGVESNTANSDDEIVWVLEANAKVPGVNYRDLFDVPVFRTKDSPSVAPEQARSAPFSAVTEAPVERPRHSRIIVKPAETGGREFDFTPARNPGAALNVTTFFIIWSGAIWFMIAFKAPALFPVVFGLFDLLLLYMVLDLWLGTSTVVIGSGSVSVRRGFMGLGKRCEYLCSEITDIKMPVGMQTGERSGTPYYNISLALLSGKNQVVAEAIKDKQEAEWLIEQMREAIGLKKN